MTPDPIDTLEANLEHERRRNHDLERRLDALERKRLGLDDLPLAALQRKLEQSWCPDPIVLFAERSIPRVLLAPDAAPSRGIQEDAARAVQIAGDAAPSIQVGNGWHPDPAVVGPLAAAVLKELRRGRS